MALSQDHAFAQPPGSQLRATVLGQQLAVAISADEPERATTWFTSALRFLGCTGHTFAMAVVFGDEIEMRAESLQLDFANPFDMMRLMVTHTGAGTTGVRRMRTVLAVLAGGKKAAGLTPRRTGSRRAPRVRDRPAPAARAVHAALADVACSAHERVDGSGYHRRANGTHLDAASRVLAAADCYAGADLRPAPPARVDARRRRGGAARDERGRPARR